MAWTAIVILLYVYHRGHHIFRDERCYCLSNFLHEYELWNISISDPVKFVSNLTDLCQIWHTHCGYMDSNYWLIRTEIEWSLSCKHLNSNNCGPTKIRSTPQGPWRLIIRISHACKRWIRLWTHWTQRLCACLRSRRPPSQVVTRKSKKVVAARQARTPRPLAWGKSPGGCRWYCIFDLASASSGRFYSINSSQHLLKYLPIHFCSILEPGSHY